MSETGDEFAGTAQRSTKHSPRVDEELEHEIQGMVRGGHSTRAEEWRDPEPVAEGEPDIDAVPTGTYVGGTPVGMDADAVEARAELGKSARSSQRASSARASTASASMPTGVPPT